VHPIRTQPQAGNWPLHDGTPPFIRLDRDPGGVRMTGTSACDLGTPLPDPHSDRVDGVHCGWRWDGSDLTAWVDPLGFHSLFVYSHGNRIAVSPSLLQLIADGADTEPDRRALAVFFRLGMFINDDTPFRHIRTLPPGGRLVWRDGTATISGGPVTPPERRIDRKGAVDGFIELPRASLRRIADAWDDDFVLPLSGGRDSRHILLDLHHIGRPPRAAVTFQYSAPGLNCEAQSARALCESTGTPHQVLGRWRSRSRDILRALALTSLCSDEHSQMMALHDFLGHIPRAASLDGIAGDILTNPDDHAEAQFRLSSQGRFHDMAREMFAGHGAVVTADGSGLGAILDANDHEQAVDYLGGTIAGFADAADPYQAFWFWNRTRREIGFVASAIQASAAAVYCPFLVPEFVDFSLSLPYAVTRDQRLHDDAIARGYPAQAHIPYADGFTDPPLGRSLPMRLRQALTGIGTVLALHPGHPLREIATWVRGMPPLHRVPGNIHQLFTLAIEGIDADAARQLLALERRYRAAEPDDQIVATHDPEATDAD
jgi:hypothetical protein